VVVVSVADAGAGGDVVVAAGATVSGVSEDVVVDSGAEFDVHAAASKAAPTRMLIIAIRFTIRIIPA
jgi:hypothetical protein